MRDLFTANEKDIAESYIAKRKCKLSKRDLREKQIIGYILGINNDHQTQQLRRCLNQR